VIRNNAEVLVVGRLTLDEVYLRDSSVLLRREQAVDGAKDGQFLEPFPEMGDQRTEVLVLTGSLIHLLVDLAAVADGVAVQFEVRDGSGELLELGSRVIDLRLDVADGSGNSSHQQGERWGFLLEHQRQLGQDGEDVPGRISNSVAMNR